MEFCISSDELRKALKDIEAAEKNGFYDCLSVFKFVLDENLAEYSDMIEKADSINGCFYWGRGQNVTKYNKFINGKVVPIERTPYNK